MATLATILRKFDTVSAEPARTAAARPNPYQLRALPNEDIFFHTKRVDNSRLVREADPRAKAECWSTIGAVCALAVVLISAVAPSVAGITAGYQIQALQQERQRLLDERRGLEVAEARLLDPERLERLAKDQKMTPPKGDQVVHFEAAGSDGTVAFNASAKKDK
jgi:cell division protein FtsL